jgi:uncharacterized membrane protein YphA (DoxX/SURF4 family)
MTYNTSWMDQSYNVLRMVKGVNSMTDGYVMGMFIALLWFILYITFQSRGYNSSETLIATDLVVSIVGGIMVALGMIPAWFIAIPLILLMVGIIIKIWFGG